MLGAARAQRDMKDGIHPLDAMRVLTQGAPAGGNPNHVKAVGAVAVSVNPVAADAWAATAVGADPSEVRGLGLAEQRRLGRADLKAVAPVEIVAG